MQTNIFDKIEGGARPLRLTVKTAKALIEDLGVEKTLNQYLRSICEGGSTIHAIGVMAKEISDFYNIDEMEAISNTISFFNYFNTTISIGEDDAKFLLEAKITAVHFKPDLIAIDTTFSEDEYEQALETDRPLSR